MKERKWTPEKVVANVLQTRINESRLFIRGGQFANTDAFMQVMLPYNTPRPDKKNDGRAFGDFIAYMAYRMDLVALTVIEATVTIPQITVIDALRSALQIADDQNRILERVIPVVVVDQNRAHTLYERSSIKNPNGPKEVAEHARKLGAITVLVTPENLAERFGKVIDGIMKGQMPEVD